LINQSINQPTAGSRVLATANNARANFSPSPTHFDVKHAALMLKNVAPHCEAMQRPGRFRHSGKMPKPNEPIMVLPVPGGPNNKTPEKY
jgi:hypothetical protein